MIGFGAGLSGDADATRKSAGAASWLDAYAPLRDLESEQRAAFAALPVRHAPAGALLFAPGSACQGFILVLEGGARVDMTGASGRSITLYRVGRDETCVQTTLCMMGAGAYAATGVAETALSFILVPPPLFERAMAQSAAFRRFVFRRFAVRLDEVTRLLETVAFVRIEARLAAALLARARRAGALGFEATHQDLADEIGTAREVVSRQLDALRREGLVASGRGRLEILDMGRLENLAASAS